MNDTTFFIISIFFIIILSFGIGFLTQDVIISTLRNIGSEDITTPEDCENLTMKDTAYCLNNYIKSIYKFTERNDNESPTLEELKQEGGDCLNWAELYTKHIKKLGFYSERPEIDTSKKTAHTFAIISDETGYCILDQRNIKCVGLKDGK